MAASLTKTQSYTPHEWEYRTPAQLLSNLPSPLTGKELWAQPVLDWFVAYDNNANPYAAVRVDFNGEIKAVPASGTVEFENVDPAADIPYTVYILELNHPNISYDDLSGTVTVVDADVTENVTYGIVSARVTQFYIEVALGEDLLALPAARVTQFYMEVTSPHWEYDLTAGSLRLTPELSAPLFGLDLSVEALSMRLSPQLSEAPLYVAYVLTAHGSRLLSRLSEARINTQGLCIFYTFTGHLCILEQLEAKQAILADMTEDLGVYDSLEVYEPINYKLEVVWRT